MLKTKISLIYSKDCKRGWFIYLGNLHVDESVFDEKRKKKRLLGGKPKNRKGKEKVETWSVFIIMW